MYQNKQELEKILPHKLPMVLVDRVVAFDLEEKSLSAQVDIIPDIMFFEQDSKTVPVFVGIEYMAQTIGAYSGICLKQAGEIEPKLGFIIGSRNYECFVDNFLQGQILQIKVQELFFDSEFGSFECVITEKGKLLAKAQLNVFQPKNLEKITL